MTSNITSGSQGGGVPLGKGSDDEPANTLPAEPVQSTRDKPAAGKSIETPQRYQEEDIPSDGRDKKGEAMIDGLKGAKKITGKSNAKGGA